MAVWLADFLSRQNLLPTAHVIPQTLLGPLHLLSSLLLAILYSPRLLPTRGTNTSKPYGVILPGRRVLSLFSFSWNININGLFLRSCFLLQPQGTGTFSWSLCQTEAMFEGVGRHAGRHRHEDVSDVIRPRRASMQGCSTAAQLSQGFFVICVLSEEERKRCK